MSCKCDNCGCTPHVNISVKQNCIAGLLNTLRNFLGIGGVRTIQVSCKCKMVETVTDARDRKGDVFNTMNLYWGM
jgi:hypothetical protein